MDTGVARGQNLLHHDHTNMSCIAQGSNWSMSWFHICIFGG